MANIFKRSTTITQIDNLVTKLEQEIKPKIEDEEIDHELIAEREVKRRKCLFRNGHGCQEKWDIFVMILAIYNSFTIPLQVTFHLHSMDHPVYVLVDTFINVIFICDMLVNFRTTYIDEETGEEVTDPKEIASNYLRSRFKIDLIGVIPYDDIARFCIACGGSHSVNWIILIKMIRVLKVYDVISSLKVKEEVKLASKLLKIIYLFVLYLHIQACAWYYIVEQDEHWYPPIEVWGRELEFYEGDMLLKYFNCLFHTLLMFDGDDIGPLTTFQIIWCCVCIFIGALLEAELFGHIAALVQQMGKKEHEVEEKHDMVNNAIKSLSIPEKLQLKIEGYLAYTQETLESQNELKSFLEVISPSLKEEVIQHIFKESLSENPIFNFDDQLIVKFTKRLEIQVNSPEDVVINQGDKGEHLYIISKGEFIVSVQGHDSSSEVTNVIKSGDIFGEVALLLNCKRTATVKANNYATIAKIDKRSFSELLRQFDELQHRLKEKVRTYNDRLKLFLFSIIKVVPFLNNLSEDTLENIAYHMKQKFYEKGEIIYNNGESMDNSISIVSKGEVELLYKVDNKEFRMHLLNQGCYIGGYQIHGRYHHMYTARALSKTTIHIISKESIDHLVKEFPDFKKRIDKTVDYIEKTADPIVSFGYYRDRNANVTVKDILKLSIGRIICIKRELKRVNILNSINSLLTETQTNTNYMKTISNDIEDFQNEIINVILKLSSKIDSNFDAIEGRLSRIESFYISN